MRYELFNDKIHEEKSYHVSPNNSPCTPKALSPGLERQILGVKLAHVLFNCGMHTASDSTRRSRYTTLWFRTCADTLLYAHRARGNLRGANATPSMCMGFNPSTFSNQPRKQHVVSNLSDRVSRA